MTVIAWDGRTLAADKRNGYGTMIGTVTKVYRYGDLLVGGAGDGCFISAMREWVKAGRDPDKFPAHQGSKDDWCPIMVIEADGSCLIYERSPYPTRLEQRFMAIGSGREYAMAAMHLGKTAAEAVEVASALDSACGNGVDTLPLRASEELTLRAV